jgi:putative ABC transport system ATP-binding protein
MIKLQNINKTYNDKKVLDNFNLEISKNETIILRGRSGGGKSTILSLMAGFSKPQSGEVEISGEKITKLNDNFASNFRLENIGFVFQKFNLIKNLSVLENVTLPLIPLNLSFDELEDRAIKVLEQFDMQEYLHTKVSNLSGGEEQRVAISRALINNPKILLADEPTANLDERLANEFLEFVKNSSNLTIVIATHDELFFNQGFKEIRLDAK